jgi:hypothetical protein
MARTAHRFAAHHDQVPLTVPLPRFEGMDWPGDERSAEVPVALLLASRGECSCDGCCEAFVHLVRKARLHAV